MRNHIFSLLLIASFFVACAPTSSSPTPGVETITPAVAAPQETASLPRLSPSMPDPFTPVPCPPMVPFVVGAILPPDSLAKILSPGVDHYYAGFPLYLPYDRHL